MSNLYPKWIYFQDAVKSHLLTIRTVFIYYLFCTPYKQNSFNILFSFNILLFFFFKQNKASLDGIEVATSTRGGRKSFMLSGAVLNNQAIIKCRLHQRGEGWETRQERYVEPNHPNVLIERNVLERPDKEPVVVTRYFNKTSEDVQSAFEQCVNDLKEHTK